MKSILQQCVNWSLSCVFGVFGSYAYTHWRAEKMEKVAVLRSSRSELTDNSGRVVAFWGTDRGNDTVLAFLQKANQIGSMKHPVDLKYGGYLSVARNPKIR